MVILVIYLQLYGLVDGGRMAIVPGVLIVSFPSGSNSGDSRGNQTPSRAAPGEFSWCTQANNRKWCRECSVQSQIHVLGRKGRVPISLESF